MPYWVFSQKNTPSINPDDLFEIQQAAEIAEPPAWMERQLNPAAPAVDHGESSLKTNACASAFIMNTPYNSNNGQRGCMFDILAANTLTVRCFESNLYAGTTANYEIYYRAGTHVGFENNAAAWTFLGGAAAITSAGNNMATALPIPINVTIPAGQRYSFYITNDFGAGTSYTDGTAVGNFLASDANLTVFEGVGKSYPFGLTFNVRNFNGTIFYDLGGVLEGDANLLQGEVDGSGAVLSWEVPQIEEYSNLKLERSADGQRFEHLADLPLVEAGGHADPELAGMGTAYYRLRMQMKDGSWASSEAVELQMEIAGGLVLKQQWPNPFAGSFHCEVSSSKEQMVRLEVLDAVGKVVHAETHTLRSGAQTLEVVPVEPLSAGMYFLRMSGEQGMVTSRISAL